MPRNSEAVSQSTISTKRSPNKMLYRKISIQSRKISNYGTSSSLRGGMVGAFNMKLVYRSKVLEDMIRILLALRGVKPTNLIFKYSGVIFLIGLVFGAFCWPVCSPKLEPIIGYALGGTVGMVLASKHVKRMPRKDNMYLFSIDAEFEDHLNKGFISENLKYIFEIKGFSLSENATNRKENNDIWVITDEEKIYIVKKEDGKLNIYDNISHHQKKLRDERRKELEDILKKLEHHGKIGIMVGEVGIGRDLGVSYVFDKEQIKEVKLVHELPEAQHIEEKKKAKEYYNEGLVAHSLGKLEKAEENYIKAIKLNSSHAGAHGAYGLLLIEHDKRKDAWKETELASNFFEERMGITGSHLPKALFFERYSEKKRYQKKFLESAEDSYNAGKEYLRAAENAVGDIKYAFELRGNELKAKSFVRKVPTKSWYKKIFSKNPNIPGLIDNLKNATMYYKKASSCPIGENQDVCYACYSVMSVFSDILTAMSAFIKGDNVPINKDKWGSSLGQARKIYTEKKFNKGVTFVDTLVQLIKCVDELSNQKASGVDVEEYLKKCYYNLIDVSDKLEGALKINTYYAVIAIRDYAKKQGMGFVEVKKSNLSNWLVGAIAAIIFGVIAGIIANRLFALDLDLKILNLIKYVLP